jgi:hypothetical protein
MNMFTRSALRLLLVISMVGSHAALAQNLDWSSARNLSANGEDSRQPRIAVSSDGTKATAVWYRYDGASHIVQTSSATIEKGIAKWGAVSDLSLTGKEAQQPNIAVSSDGTKATAVWYENDGVDDIAQSASATIIGNVATWGATNDLSASGESVSYKVQIGLSSDGTKATAIWSRSNGSPDFDRIAQSASATISGNTATWSSVTDLSAAGASASENEIALSSDGSKATAVWYRSNGANSIIQSASATISGNTATWSDVNDLSAIGGSAYDPFVELSSDGTVSSVIWYRDDAEGDAITQSAIASISGNAASWGSVTDLSEAGEYSYGAHIALSSDGTKATAVWNRYDGNFNINQSASATITGNTASWGSTVDISADGSDSDTPYIELSSDGLIAVGVWEGRNGDFSVIQAALANIAGNTATWGALKNISRTGQHAGDPKIALSTDGENSTALWTRSNGDNRIVQSVSSPIDNNCFVIKSKTDETIIFCL